jgi:hypothetical protein
VATLWGCLPSARAFFRPSPRMPATALMHQSGGPGRASSVPTWIGAHDAKTTRRAASLAESSRRSNRGCDQHIFESSGCKQRRAFDDETDQAWSRKRAAAIVNALRQIPRPLGRPAGVARTGGCLRELAAASIQPAYKLSDSVRLCASRRPSRQAVRSGCPKIAFARSRLREETRAVAVPQEDGPCCTRAQDPGACPTLSGVGSSDTGR